MKLSILGGWVVLVAAGIHARQSDPAPAAPEQSSPPSTSAAAAPIVVGAHIDLESEVLGEARRLRVSVPDSYVDTDADCAVLYLLDGESLFLQAVAAARHLGEFEAPPLIVVGIDNTERTRDLTPPATDPTTLADFPAGGGSAAFRRFLLEEVVPFIEGRYRTNGIELLAGHSFGGLFTAETLLDQPEAFDAYLVLSPSLWWDDARFVERFEDVPASHGLFERFVWFAMGDEGAGMNPHFEAVTWGLRDRGVPGFRWDRAHYVEHDHWAAALPALGGGLRAYFEPLRTIGVEAMSFADVERDFARARRAFGDAVSMSAGPIVRRARSLSGWGEFAAALEILAGALDAIPDEPLLTYVQAEVFGQAGRSEEGIAALVAAIAKYSQEERHTEAVAWLERQLETLRLRLEGE